MKTPKELEALFKCVQALIDEKCLTDGALLEAIPVIKDLLDKYNSLESFIKEKASKKIASDNEDFNAYDYSGCNIDDAYDYGINSGEKWLAQEIQNKFFPKEA